MCRSDASGFANVEERLSLKRQTFCHRYVLESTIRNRDRTKMLVAEYPIGNDH